MNEIECETCIKRKTKYCPNSSECYNTTDKPHYQNRIMLLEENWKLKKQLEEKENQQKEFMEWLESESHRLSGDVLLNSSFIEVRTILLKYKEIIGADNEN